VEHGTKIWLTNVTANEMVTFTWAIKVVYLNGLIDVVVQFKERQEWIFIDC
jgi:hypothetical protein